MNKDHYQCAREVLTAITYATIATVSPDGRPWNSPVWYMLDNALNLYWFSDKANQHSQNIRHCEHVFIVIYDSTDPHSDGNGVYMEATAHELDDADEIRAVRRRKKGPGHDAPGDFMDDAHRRVYRATPHRIWSNSREFDNGTFVRDCRIELDLEQLRSSLSGSLAKGSYQQ